MRSLSKYCVGRVLVQTNTSISLTNGNLRKASLMPWSFNDGFFEAFCRNLKSQGFFKPMPFNDTINFVVSLSGTHMKFLNKINGLRRVALSGNHLRKVRSNYLKSGHFSICVPLSAFPLKGYLRGAPLEAGTPRYPYGRFGKRKFKKTFNSARRIF